MEVKTNRTETLLDLQTVLIVVQTTNVVVNLPINIYTVCLMLRAPQEKIASDFLALHQNVSEMFISLSGIFFFLRFLPFGPVVHALYNFCHTMSICSRPLYQCHVCLEQYLAVVHPVLFLKCKPLRYRVALCCVSWLMVIAVSSVNWVLKSPRQLFAFITASYVFMFMVMSYCCVMVLRALKRPAPGDGKAGRGNSMKERAFKMICFNLVYILLSQMPMVVSLFVRSITLNLLSYVFSVFSGSVFIMTSFVPSLLYLHRVGKLSTNCICC